MKVSDIKIEGYPDLNVILAHFNAIPVLISHLRDRPSALHEWDMLRGGRGGGSAGDVATDRLKGITVTVVGAV